MTALPAPRLLDQFGRVGRDLRVSVTDRCNLRCTYCMPAEGLDWLPKPEMLTDDELVRLVSIMVGMGVTTVRLTGGEPLLRRSLVGVVGRIATLEPRPRIAMTTNGIGLDRLAAPLAAAGLDRVNVSLDTIDARQFTDLTRRDRLQDVVAGLKAASDAGLAPVKVNAVAMRGVNDGDVAELLHWCLDRGYELRFIEQMPLDAQHAWDRTRMVSQAEILGRLGERFRLTPVPERGSARLTADGQLRNCLFARREVDLRGPLRQGASDAELADLVVAEMWAKKAGHGIDRPDFEQPQRPMSAIGG